MKIDKILRSYGVSAIGNLGVTTLKVNFEANSASEKVQHCGGPWSPIYDRLPTCTRTWYHHSKHSGALHTLRTNVSASCEPVKVHNDLTRLTGYQATNTTCSLRQPQAGYPARQYGVTYEFGMMRLSVMFVTTVCALFLVKLWDFWNHRCDLVLEDGLVVKGDRVFATEPLRAQVLQLIHYGHQGETQCLLLSKQSKFCPGISRGVRQMVKSFEPFNKHPHAQQKLPATQPELPTRPWEKLRTNMFTFNGSIYLMIVDVRNAVFRHSL